MRGPRMMIVQIHSEMMAQHFIRTDSILEVEILEESIGMSKSKLRRQWQQWRDAEILKRRTGQ